MRWLLFLLIFINILNASLLELNHTHQLDMTYHSFILEDSTNKTINDIMDEENWQPLSKENHPSGYAQTTYWIKSEVIKRDIENYVLNYDIIYPYAVEAYFVQDNIVVGHKQFGFRYPNSSYYLNAYELNLEQNKPLTIYTKIQSNIYPLNFSLQVYEKSLFDSYYIRNQTVFMLYYFILIVFSIYNIILYFITKYKHIKVYLLYLLTIICLSFIKDGFFTFYLFDTAFEEYTVLLLHTLRLLFVFSIFYLISEILELRYKLRYLYQTMMALFCLAVVLDGLRFVVYAFADISLLSSITHFLIMSIFLLLSFCIFIRGYQRNLYGMVMSIIWIPLLGLFFLYFLNHLYALLDNIYLSYIGKSIVLLETFCLSTLLLLKGARTQKEYQHLLLKQKNQELLDDRKMKLITMGEMLNNIAHEWKKPLARINSIVFGLQFAKKENLKSQLNDKLTKIEYETQQMSETITSFTSYFHPNKNATLLDIKAILQKKKEEISQQVCSFTQIEIDIKNNDFEVWGHKNEYEKVISVIVDNAIDVFKFYAVKQPTIRFTLKHHNKKPVLSIENNGPKIAKEHINQLFDPYFTTEYYEKSTGIGLYMAKMLVEDSMQKKLTVENTRYGVRFNIEG